MTDRGDHPGTGPWVCDGLMQMHMAMKHLPGMVALSAQSQQMLVTTLKIDLLFLYKNAEVTLDSYCSITFMIDIEKN